MIKISDLQYSRLLSVSDDEKEFVTLEELKTHHLTDLENPSKTNLTFVTQDDQDQSYNVYYDLNTQKSK